MTASRHQRVYSDRSLLLVLWMIRLSLELLTLLFLLVAELLLLLLRTLRLLPSLLF